MTSKPKRNRKIRYPVEPVDKINKIRYLSEIEMDDGTKHIFTLTEMQHISDMFESFKEQFGWHPDRTES